MSSGSAYLHCTGRCNSNPRNPPADEKDIEYRNNAASIKMVVTVDDEEVMNNVDEAVPDSPTLKTRVCLSAKRDGWHTFRDEFVNFPDTFERPTGSEDTTINDIMLIYFTSGTTGMPKMVQHNFAYPLGHIVTAKYWQNVQNNGLHFTVSDTGWAKAVWGKLYGQWICGSAVFVYDYNHKFEPAELMHMIEKYRITTFCAPPTIYRFFIKADLRAFDFSSLKYCVVAGEPLNPEVYRQFYDATGIRLMEVVRPDRNDRCDCNTAMDETKARFDGKTGCRIRD